jgi:potassium-dependent mechanosensitive channel
MDIYQGRRERSTVSQAPWLKDLSVPSTDDHPLMLAAAGKYLSIPLVIRIALLTILGLVSSATLALSQHSSVSPAKSNLAVTSVALAKIPLEAQYALASLKEIETKLSVLQLDADGITKTLADAKSEVDARIADDSKLLTTSPGLDLLYRLKVIWRQFGVRFGVLDGILTRHATSLEEQIQRLDQFNNTWQETLQAAKESGTPAPIFQLVQNVLDSTERAQRVAEPLRVLVFTLQSQLSEEEARQQTALSSIELAEKRALQNIMVEDSSPLWGVGASLSTEWEKHSSESFASQLKASTTFTKRNPFGFLIHGLFVVLVATALHWMRRRIRKSSNERPDLQRALPILDLPVATAIALSIFLIPVIYEQAPRLILAVMGALTLIPAAMILRRLLDRHSYPILNAIVLMYFVGQLRVLAASLPVLARLLFLCQILGVTLFLVWVLRNWPLPEKTAESNGRVWRTIRAIAKVGLIILPLAFLANMFGYVNLGNLLGIVFLRSVYIAAMLYTAIRIIEGLIIVALGVRPLASLRVVRLHRTMLQGRACLVLELLAILFWFNLLLNFFGLATPVITMAQAALNANLGFFNITLGRFLAFVLAIWASFMVSKFLRFLLEEDVYPHLNLARGIPYAISTMLHYVLLLFGVFLGLGALGIDLTKVTILAGAFTVGIGFGLQNVINNFVSGLILLFERPIKVGDVIEVGGNVGEVSRIGIRASVIRTADGSEVIVPNGALISSQVTNWTFSDRRRAVEVSVNVVGGTDSQGVIDLLKTTAAANPGITKEPPPQVYIVNFSAGAVTFQLRAWTDRHQDWAQLRSDLSLAVNDALAREKIAIA